MILYNVTLVAHNDDMFYKIFIKTLLTLRCSILLSLLMRLECIDRKGR
jgi:hypothetical protein